MTIQQVGQKLESMAGLKPGTTDEILREIRENRAKLDSCKGPHQFTENVGGRPIFTKWRCTLCGAVIRSEELRWYKLGLKHGLAEGAK